MKILFSKNSWLDFNRWQIDDQLIFRKINRLLKEINQNPYQGSGKPTSLRFDLNGLWSRCIDREHRLIYQVIGDKIFIYSCRYYPDN